MKLVCGSDHAGLRLKEELKKHLEEKGITVHDVVGQVPLSRRVLEARFKQMLGRTPHAEIIRARLERARRRDHAMAGGAHRVTMTREPP